MSPSNARGGTVSPAATSGATSRRKVAGERSRRRPAAERQAAPRLPARAPKEPAAPRAARPEGRRWWRSRWLLASLSVLAAVAVAGAVWLAGTARQHEQVSDARTTALQSAGPAAELVLSYDHTTLDQDFAAALEVTTGDFREEYRRTSENAVRQVATESEAVVEADVVSSAVVSATADRVVVLLFVNQTTTSNRLDAPQTDQNRVRMTMVRDAGSGRWLVSEVDAL
jgi:Mce-associated membrane protein